MRESCSLTRDGRALLVWTSSNITAGSDTTAIFLRALIHQLLTHPSSLKTLLAELEKAANDGQLDSLASWKQTHDLPYLTACINEAGRLHPPFGLPFEREVPPEGAVVCGQPLKGGTVVGMSAWVTHRDRDTFGEDCDEWRPERWLCEADERKRMEAALLTVCHARFPPDFRRPLFTHAFFAAWYHNGRETNTDILFLPPCVVRCRSQVMLGKEHLPPRDLQGGADSPKTFRCEYSFSNIFNERLNRAD